MLYTRCLLVSCSPVCAGLLQYYLLAYNLLLNWRFSMSFSASSCELTSYSQLDFKLRECRDSTSYRWYHICELLCLRPWSLWKFLCLQTLQKGSQTTHATSVTTDGASGRLCLSALCSGERGQSRCIEQEVIWQKKLWGYTTVEKSEPPALTPGTAESWSS